MMEFLNKLWAWLVEFFKAKTPELPPATEPTKPAEPVEHVPETIRIERGQTGPAVAAIQNKLKEIGYAISVDGDFGEETERVVKQFQAENSIGQTGVVGPQTYAALMKAKHRTTQPDVPKVMPTASIMVKAADIADAEANKNLKWTDMHCEAEKYLASCRKALGMPNGRYPWCGAFVTWCVREAGGYIPDVLVRNLTTAYVPAWQEWAQANGLWVSSRDKGFNPVKGNIVIFDWDRNGGEADHIGIVLRYTPGTAVVYTAEGNTSSENNSNGNQTAHRVRNWADIKGFIRFK